MNPEFEAEQALNVVSNCITDAEASAQAAQAQVLATLALVEEVRNLRKAVECAGVPAEPEMPLGVTLMLSSREADELHGMLADTLTLIAANPVSGGGVNNPGVELLEVVAARLERVRRRESEVGA